MDWTVAFPFPLSEIFQVALLAGLDLAGTLTIFAGCLFAERSLRRGRITRATWLMVGLLGGFETILAFIGAAFPGEHFVGPIRLAGISVVLVTVIWMTRGSTRRIA